MRLVNLKDGLRRSYCICRALVGNDVFARVQVRCRKLQLGNENASWCICPDGLTETSTVYSFGVGHDISFDLAVIQRFGAVVHGFDPTPRSAAWIRKQPLPDKFIFHEYGVGSHDGLDVFYPPANPDFVSYSVMSNGMQSEGKIEAQVYRLISIMKLLGHDRIDLLKIDIEGGEYNAIADLVRSGIRPEQLLVEFHHRWPGLDPDMTRKAISCLNHTGYRIFHISPRGEEYSFLLQPSS